MKPSPRKRRRLRASPSDDQDPIDMLDAKTGDVRTVPLPSTPSRGKAKITYSRRTPVTPGGTPTPSRSAPIPVSTPRTPVNKRFSESIQASSSNGKGKANAESPTGRSRVARVPRSKAIPSPARPVAGAEFSEEEDSESSGLEGYGIELGGADSEEEGRSTDEGEEDGAEGSTDGPQTPSKKTGARNSLPSTPTSARGSSTRGRPPGSGRGRGRGRGRGGSATSTPSRGVSAPLDVQAEPEVGTSSLIRPSTSDAYFLSHSRSSKTSNAQLSAKLAPLPPGAYAKSLSTSSAENDALSRARAALEAEHTRRFGTWAAELRAGFNLVFTGLGDSSGVLERFVRERTSRGQGAAMIVNGLLPGLRVEGILGELERSCALVEADFDDLTDGISNVKGLSKTEKAKLERSTISNALESRTRRFASRFSGDVRTVSTASSATNGLSKAPPRIFLLINDIDAPALRAPRAQRALSILAAAPRIHLLASIKHVNAPLLWGVDEACARPFPSRRTSHLGIDEDEQGARDGKAVVSQTMGRDRSFNWLWHDLTTFAPPDLSILLSRPLTTRAGGPAALDPAPGAGGGATSASRPIDSVRDAGHGVQTGGNQEMGEAAAMHVLRSVTTKARALFVLLAQRQLDAGAQPNVSGAATESTPTPSTARRTIPYTTLAETARRSFIATTDAALRALLVEFTDHGLIRRGVGPGAADIQADGIGQAQMQAHAQALVADEVVWIPMPLPALQRTLEGVKEL